MAFPSSATATRPATNPRFTSIPLYPALVTSLL
jgi:hypothetical protein